MVARRLPAAIAFALVLACLLVLSCSSVGKKQVPEAEAGAGEGRDDPLSIESTVWQFGTLKRGETATHSLKLMNEGSEDLKVSVHSSCDCLTARLDDEILAAGTATDINLSFLGETVKQKVTKTIYIDAGQAAQRIELTVTGEVTRGDGPHLYPAPTMLLAERSGEAYKPALLSIANRGRAELVVTEVRCYGCSANRSFFALAEDEETEIEVNVEEGWTQDKRWLEIDSNDPVEGTRKVPVVVAE